MESALSAKTVHSFTTFFRNTLNVQFLNEQFKPLAVVHIFMVSMGLCVGEFGPDLQEQERSSATIIVYKNLNVRGRKITA